MHPNFLKGHMRALLTGSNIVSSMKDGVYAWVAAALDTKDGLALRMIDAGVEPAQAILASSVAVKDEVREALERNLGEQSASVITHGLKAKRGVQTRPN